MDHAYFISGFVLFLTTGSFYQFSSSGKLLQNRVYFFIFLQGISCFRIIKCFIWPYELWQTKRKPIWDWNSCETMPRYICTPFFLISLLPHTKWLNSGSHIVCGTLKIKWHGGHSWTMIGLTCFVYSILNHMLGFFNIGRN